jgi:elongator complex protein 3
MPKSYLSNEPAGMRALMLEFDPYIQVRQRLEAAERIGHRAEKVELLILGGTWSSYPPDYQEWFIRRMFDALNGVDAETLEEAHAINETAGCRNTGLVVETRPDHVTLEEITRLRRMGVTRVQIGAQSLNDHILEINKRGHTLEQFREAMRLLRGAGFKVIVHWMPNLLGATPESDLEEFRQFWSDPTLRPDELKIYPTGLLRGTELFEYYQRGEYQPYSDQQTLDLLKACKVTVPGYCRLDRVMRDIPKPEIVEGVTTSNLRQIAQAQLKVEGRPCRCVRCREVKRSHVDPNTATLKVEWYDTDHSQEAFISIVTDDDLLTGFLRLSLPTTDVPFEEIEGCGMIRQVQVYGPALALGESADGPAQHQGFGTTLLGEAFRLTAEKGFKQIAVIAAVGTREYYRRFGFRQGNLYMLRDL